MLQYSKILTNFNYCVYFTNKDILKHLVDYQLLIVCIICILMFKLYLKRTNVLQTYLINYRKICYHLNNSLISITLKYYFAANKYRMDIYEINKVIQIEDLDHLAYVYDIVN